MPVRVNGSEAPLKSPIWMKSAQLVEQALEENHLRLKTGHHDHA
jgi:hypothetical protein